MVKISSIKLNEVIDRVNARPGPADEVIEYVTEDLEVPTTAHMDEAPEVDPTRDWPTYIDLKDIWNLLENPGNKTLWHMVGKALVESDYSVTIALTRSKAQPLLDLIKQLKGELAARKYVEAQVVGTPRDKMYELYVELRRAVEHDELMVASLLVEATKDHCI